jgi:glycosyltransferase involved in cell wall biosynthesis
MGHTLQRFVFNAGISPDAVADADVVIGLDMDGFTVSGRCRRFVCYLMGVLADEAIFERALPAGLLRLQARSEQISATRADMVLTTSQYSRRRASEEYGIPTERIRVVPPAFDVQRWRSDLAAAAPRPSGSGRSAVLCVAHMYPRKNIAALIRATRLLADRVPGIEVRVVGNGPERAHIQGLAKSLGVEAHVRLLGQLSHRDLVTEFSSCDVFCLPSLQEGFGIVFLEAMASGKPVVGCRTSSTPELVEHGVNGFLASPHDDLDLAEQLHRCLEDADLRISMSEANVLKAEQYDVSKTTSRLIDLVAASV